MLNQELMRSFTTFISVFIGMGLYQILCAIAIKIKKQALSEELNKLADNPILNIKSVGVKGFSVSITKNENNKQEIA